MATAAVTSSGKAGTMTLSIRVWVKPKVKQLFKRQCCRCVNATATPGPSVGIGYRVMSFPSPVWTQAVGTRIGSMAGRSTLTFQSCRTLRSTCTTQQPARHSP
ncbi:uncharacterized protein LOC119766810 [Culex quinquefasciatus]|uniref:uncharacterized protein LOC119766810 n=1 Tax=Culex quinquefasciatus TaxID=7176 RepID=UPI0018E3B899|nr:uncharacterized protein LOC119766810 [Culex quinquefasciatus]XP_038108626.1 uncharacterized protein LOC119766810 [Culex quinquefasciatus]